MISAGSGIDTISIAGAYGPTTVTAGLGDDTVTGIGNGGQHSVDAGEGADTLRLNLNSSASLTLGAGADKIILDSWNGSATATVADFAVAEDKLDLTTLLNTLQGWDGSANPFGAGFLQLVQDGADALLQVDRNGGGNSYTTLIKFQTLDLATTSLTSGSLIPNYNPNGSGVAGQTINGDGGNNVLQGTFGDDIISGLSGDDQINGGSGGDQLFGGAGKDILRGSFGNDFLSGGTENDTFSFSAGSGQDTITDFASGDLIEIDLDTPVADVNAWLGTHATEVNGSAVIDLDGSGLGTDTITVKEVSLASLAADAFRFV
ncbi:hypothetical protein GCM10007888_48730 [Methylobacterium oxalidis]|uniref:Hemolysin expression modulating protein n=1 Tax=Methylobacterium oxalidis TaxID=944322 RepID=A0ABQ6DQV0_9HYPH|nr:Alginate lyase 7 [Methylobacterium oxalidis]GLS66490.1 hypothetical protein GCM10007888_48730 [Methylobacterium oxalidis]